MKVLLIGFSEQSAAVLAAYMKQHYPNHQCVIVERSFGDNLRLSLPTINKQDDDAVAMIISLEGVGMINHSLEYAKELKEFIGKRAALIVTRSSLLLWRESKIAPNELIFFLKSPFDKRTMTYTLKELMQVAHTVKLSKIQPVKTQDTNNTQDDSQATADNHLASQKLHIPHFFHTLLDDYFELPQKMLLHEMLNISLINKPIKLLAGSQVAYLHKAKNMALVANIERLIDYCMVANNCQILNNVVSVQLIKDDEFEQLATLNQYQKYALNSFLWQIQSAILPQYIQAKPHNLSLKMRYMPNFAQMKDVPDYVRTVASLSLAAPRSMNQLAEMTALRQEGRPLINRVLLLAILSGSADEAVLKHSLQSIDGQNTHHQTPPKNEGIKKALGSGFLRRLIEKLNA